MALAVPNFSEGRDAGRDRGGQRRLRRAPSCSTATPTRSTTAPCSASRARGPALVEALVAGAARLHRADRHRRARAAPTLRRRARRLPGGLARRGAAHGRRRAGAGGGAGDRRARGAGVPLRRAGHRSESRAERAYFRRGGLAALRGADALGRAAARISAPPSRTRPPGATLVTARPPLAAFNVELDTADVGVAESIAAELRESGGGIGGVRAVGIDLGDRAQVSTNIHDPVSVPLAAVIERVRALAAERGARPVARRGRRPGPRGGAARAARRRAAAGVRPRAAGARAPARVGRSAADVVHVPPLVGAVDLAPAVGRAESGRSPCASRGSRGRPRSRTRAMSVPGGLAGAPSPAR